MSILVERTVLLAKVETTYGVDPAPTTTSDFIAVADLRISPNITFNDPAAMDVTLSPRQGVAGGRFVEVSFTHELQAHSSGGANPPPIAPLLKACGFAETIGTSDVTYQPVSSSFSSCTIYCYYDGLLWKITGCRGNVEIAATAGEVVRFNFTLQGLWNTPTDETFPSSVTENATNPLVAMGGSFTWGSDTPIIESISVNMNNELNMAPSVGSTYGFYACYITNRNPGGTINPEMDTLANIDWFSKLNNATLEQVVTSFTNGSQTCQVTIPQAQVRNVTPGDRNGIRTWEIEYGCVRSSGDDEVQIVFS